MGGSKGKKKKKPSVQHAAPLDYNALMRSANEQAAAAARAQVQAQIDAYPQLEALQLGTIRKIADNLNNQFTQDAMAGVDRTVGDAASVRSIGGDMRGTASEIEGIGRLLQARADETAIERTLREQAEAELGLGRSLSAEETRDAQQSARAAFAARGLGTSLGSSAAEILNRDAAAQARESNRRNFAAATNQMVSGNVFNRFGQAAGLFGNAAQVQQGAANAFAQGANIDANAAQMRANLDPYQRALGNAQIGSQLGANLQSSIGQTFGNAQQVAGNVASFNANMLDTRANSQLNNWAAMEAARRQAGAMNNAATMGMIGNIGSSIFSDRRMKKDIKPLGQASGVLGLTAYEFKYKEQGAESGEPGAKHVGFLAQDVKKVLPEAVEEVNYRGKKRLAIKPAVLGAALAQELTQAKAA